MNPLRIIITLVAIAAGFAGGWFAKQASSKAGASNAASSKTPGSNEAQYLKTYGWIIGQQSGVKALDMTPAEVDILAEGMKSVLTTSGTEIPGGEENADKVKQYLDDRFEKIQTARSAKEAETAKKFFADLDQKSNVKKTGSGLYYEIITPGGEEKPKETDEVSVKYKGTLISGEVFDETKPGDPARTLELARFIPGWREGIRLIGKGGKIKLYIPGNLAYGPRPPGPGIPPNATLIFDVELEDFRAPTNVQGFSEEDLMKMIQMQMQQQGAGGGLPPGMAPPPGGSPPAPDAPPANLPPPDPLPPPPATASPPVQAP